MENLYLSYLSKIRSEIGIYCGGLYRPRALLFTHWTWHAEASFPHSTCSLAVIKMASRVYTLGYMNRTRSSVWVLHTWCTGPSSLSCFDISNSRSCLLVRAIVVALESVCNREVLSILYSTFQRVIDNSSVSHHI